MKYKQAAYTKPAASASATIPRQSLEVRDTEMRLHETNKKLRDLPPEELDRPATRRRIEQQAAAERANGRRLENLVAVGEDLVRQASRNPEFGVGHLEKWAEMLQILKDIAANRMPSVADLLKEASEAKAGVAAKAGSTGPKAGQVRAGAGGKPSKGQAKNAKPSKIPQIANIESSQQPAGKKSAEESGKQVQLLAQADAADDHIARRRLQQWQTSRRPRPVEKMEQAVRPQQDLLAEFEKVANELNNVLANLEGSTLGETA